MAASYYLFNDTCNRLQNATIFAKNHPLFWIERVGLPTLVALCTVGNLLNIIVMSGERKTLKSVHMVSKSTKVFLLAMAVSDLLLLWFQVPLYIAAYVQNITILDNTTTALGFKNFYGVQQWGSEAFTQWSDWILIAFSIDRLRAFHHIARSFRMKTNQTEGTILSGVSAIPSGKEAVQNGQFAVVKINSDGATRAGFRRSTAIWLVLLLFVAALIFSMENGVYPFYLRMHDKGDGKPIPRPNWLLDWKFYQMICEVAMTVAKFTVLMIVNIHLIFIVISQHGGGSSMTAHRSRRQSKEKTGTNLLVGCLLVYFVTHGPSVVFQCLRLAASAPYCYYFLPVDTVMISQPIIRTILLFNYSVNFLLYFALSRKFRDELRLLPQRMQACRKKLQHSVQLRLLAAPRQRTRVSQMETVARSTSNSTTVTVADNYL